MSGSMFIHPGFYPVDILEFTPGRKDLQTYSFMGGIATNLNPNWRLGGKIDFASAVPITSALTDSLFLQKM